MDPPRYFQSCSFQFQCIRWILHGNLLLSHHSQNGNIALEHASKAAVVEETHAKELQNKSILIISFTLQRKSG